MVLKVFLMGKHKIKIDLDSKIFLVRIKSFNVSGRIVINFGPVMM